MDVLSTLVIATLITSILSLLFTFTAIGISFALKSWKKRDGILLFNIFAIDVIFSCAGISVWIQVSHKGVDQMIVLSNFFIFSLLLSWSSQCLITINRYVVIICPLTYKQMLCRSTLCKVIIGLWTVACAVLVLSSIYGNEIKSQTVYVIFFESLLKAFCFAILALHSIFACVVYALEFCLWNIAKGHQERQRSLTRSLNQNNDPTPLPPRKVSITQALQKRFSLTIQRMSVRRTPFVLLSAHLISILPYMVLPMLYLVMGSEIFESTDFINACAVAQLIITCRPILNVFNNISIRKFQRFQRLASKLFIKNSREHMTDYYIEHQEEVQTIKLRREFCTFDSNGYQHCITDFILMNVQVDVNISISSKKVVNMTVSSEKVVNMTVSSDKVVDFFQFICI